MEPRVLAHDVQGDGVPLVLVPGGLTGWLSWIPLLERLSPRYRVVRVQPVHNELGSAGQPGDAGYTALVERESLRLTLDQLGLAEAHFAGWSGGGRALLELAMQYPGRTRTMTLIEPAAYWILDQMNVPDPEVKRLNDFMHGLAGREVTENDLAMFVSLAGLVAADHNARQHPNWQQWVAHRMALSWQSEQSDRPGRQVAELGGITCPVLLIRGTRTSPWLSRVVDALAGLLPLARIGDLPGDHACHLENPDAFTAALTDQTMRG